MKMSTEELSSYLPEAQVRLVRERTSAAEMCHITLKVREDTYSGEFVAVVQLRTIVDTGEDEVLNEIMRVPTRSTSIAWSLGEFHTPRGEEYASGSTSAGGKSHRNSRREA